MKTRPKEKCALIIFNIKDERAACGYVQETLQYNEVFDRFYMLPVPNKNSKDAVSLEALRELIKTENILFQTPVYLIEKKQPSEWNKDNDNNGFDKVVVDFAKKFVNHYVSITYDYFDGENKIKKVDLDEFRKSHRYTPSAGVEDARIRQVPLLFKRTETGSVKKEPLQVGLSFLGIRDMRETPPYHYLLLDQFKKLNKKHKELDSDAKIKYRDVIQKQIAFRQEKVDPLLRSAEIDYPEPTSVAEKLGNLFHAYVHCGLISKRSHKDFAEKLANTLYECAHLDAERLKETPPKSPEWDMESCLAYIKEEIDGYSEQINPKGTFNGLKISILSMMTDRDNWQIDELLTERLNEGHKQLNAFKAKYPQLSQQIDNVSIELYKLRLAQKPRIAILRAINAAIYIIESKADESHEKQYQIGRDVGCPTSSFSRFFNAFVKPDIQTKMEELGESKKQAELIKQVESPRADLSA